MMIFVSDKAMNRTGWMGIVLAIYGVIMLIVAVLLRMGLASILSSIFMILAGVTFLCLGKDIEKPKEVKEAKEAGEAKQ
jgi:uncharacterized membrane protein YkgB